ncbi:2Fe-2S iron-sulfur cluster-binding protein [Saccharopolyspora sp. NPDC000359]|uniref:2Fe-2S iron-sulfur cluster-binding protein n=1 Tax=Saccharopolyspora sp. NPDC000359 TaxID=3154251 RepID=UPI00331FA98B
MDRSRPLSFHFDGVRYQGFAGDTLASALLANGIHQVGTSIKHGRPRGIVAAGVAEPNALVQVEEPFPEPMLPATTLQLSDGLRALGLCGQGRLAAEADPARYDTMHAHCDVLVVGAGPAGLAAANQAARTGARVIVADADVEFGGSLLGASAELDGGPALDWVHRVTEELRGCEDVRLLPSTTVLGLYEDNYVVAVQKRGEWTGPVSRQRVWRIRAREIVLATGAHERPLVFADNDRPGTMLAGAAQTYLNRYGVLAGRRAVVFTTNDSAYAAAIDLHDVGVEIACVAEIRGTAPEHWAARCAERGIPVAAGHAVVGTSGTEHVTAAHLAAVGEVTPHRREECDLLLVSGGWNPAVHLHSQARAGLRFDADLGAFVPVRTSKPVRTVGAAAGLLTTHECLADGAEAASAACARLGVAAEPAPLPRTRPVPVEPGQPTWSVPGAAGWDRHYVDLARDATVADVRRATGAGMRSVEHVKRYTTIGTGHDQGKTSGTLATGVIAEILGVDLAELGTTTFRAPFSPVAFAALAGRERGDLYDPVRVTAIHDWHVAQGAPFEDVGQWKRPWYYPRPGEDMETAVLRECRAVREGVGIQDVSTLGKIDVQGPDAAEFLDRVYTNMMSTLKVGRIRYGLMCGADGMVFDDGTVTRVSADRYLVTTTSGGAAAVLEWLEEWLQTEWPDLRVHLTSVTEQWATVALVGPRSRAVLARVAPELAVDNDSFPFMSWRDGEVAGLRARVCRISFSGELAYEINVPRWHGLALWEALIAAGEPDGITPYGTETMHVLRAEKGFPIVGQDTDGTVTPHDLGMSWAVSKKKADFIGKRSFSRPDTARENRKQLVGLLPRDPDLVLEEGAQLVAGPELPEPPVPVLGHVTSSYRSAVLGRGFALALLENGRDRIGEHVHSTVGDQLVPVEVTGPVFYDEEGSRRDG